MGFAELFKIFTYSFDSDPIARKKSLKSSGGAGVTSPEGLPSLRSGDTYWDSSIQLKDSNEFVDLNTNINRQSRYREYKSILTMPEIEWATTVFSDETCLSGDTKVSTLFDGAVEIKKLAETKKEAFLVYCWDFEKEDYTLAWARNPRLVKKAKTIKVILDDGTNFRATPDHRILLKKGNWTTIGELKRGMELMPFYRIRPNREISRNRNKQFPRIFTFTDGWKHERQFIDEWKIGRKIPEMQRVNQICRMVAEGLSARAITKLLNNHWSQLKYWILDEGFSTKELKWLGRKQKERKVVGILAAEEIDVYDLSVDNYENFCGESCIFHNCQKNDKKHTFEIECSDKEIKKEAEHLLRHRSKLNLDAPENLWSEVKQLYILGDRFWELVIDPENPKGGIEKIQKLPPDTMYRIETTKGRLVEFQQGKDGPDYPAIKNHPVMKATEEEMESSRVIRFSPDQIIHLRIGDDRREFYPYGVSLLEPARSPAHQLKLMEDSMLVYRLARAPERRIFYIDVAQLTPYKAEAFVDRMKDQFRKKKVPTNRGQGASAVEERWHAPAVDEDYWVPIRPNSNTRIDTLPGAQNLDQIADITYFRDKLFLAMGFPKNYYTTDDVQQTSRSLSGQDVKFARMIERLQSHIEDALWQIVDRHLKLRGYPEEAYEDLTVKMTPPSQWRELSMAEVVTNRINNANSLKSSMLISDYDVFVDWMQYTPEKAKELISRNTMQKLQEMKMQIYAQNPGLLGLGTPSQDNEQEIGAETGGPNPMLAPEQKDDQKPEPKTPESNDNNTKDAAGQIGMTKGPALPNPHPNDLKRYDLQIQTYGTTADREEQDYSTMDN